MSWRIQFHELHLPPVGFEHLSAGSALSLPELRDHYRQSPIFTVLGAAGSDKIKVLQLRKKSSLFSPLHLSVCVHELPQYRCLCAVNCTSVIIMFVAVLSCMIVLLCFLSGR